jgi:8-oxo-dGTP pyrophosphatase MutT (NUDIX family)
VFPGGNLDSYHDGDIPEEGSEGRHRDGLAYRLGAIRETFEETGILLAKKKHGDEREDARKKIHGNQVRFTDWVDSIGGTLDIGKPASVLGHPR